MNNSTSIHKLASTHMYNCAYKVKHELEFTSLRGWGIELVTTEIVSDVWGIMSNSVLQMVMNSFHMWFDSYVGPIKP